MQPNEPVHETQARKRTAFTVMNNVRDHCEQPPVKKLLMLTLATYCNEKGVCYPSNRQLAENTGTSERTVRRLLSDLKAQGELRIQTTGRGRDTLRLIRLKKRYVETGHSYDRLNRTELCPPNNHREQPKGEGRFRKSSKRPAASFVPYPRTEEEMEAMLEERGIPYCPDYDGNFFTSMQATHWRVKDEPVWNWPKMYAARLEKTNPENYHDRA